jgi:hypothetical protein
MKTLAPTFPAQRSALGYDISGKTAQNDPPIVQRVMVPQSEAAREAAAQAEKKRKAASLAMGAASTVLTGGMGITGEAATTSKKLFGE